MFPSDRVSPVLRLYIPYWNFEPILADCLRYCEEAGMRDVLLFTDAQYLSRNQLTPPEIERECSNLSRAAERFHKAGIRVGINSSICQAPSCADHRGILDYDFWTTNADGTSLHNLPCLLDPKIEAFIRNFYFQLAQTGADYIFMDDDLRYMYTGNGSMTIGCFCPLHLSNFAERTGIRRTREELVRAVYSDPEVRRDWILFLRERLLELARLIHDSAKRGNSGVRIGMMTPCVNAFPLSGDLRGIAAALAGDDRPLVRPCIGPYSDANRMQNIPGLFHLEIIRHILGPDVDYAPEIENAPSGVMEKSAAVESFHITEGLLNRMTAPLVTTVGYTGDSPFDEPACLEMLRTKRPFWEAVRRNAPESGSAKGLRFFAETDSVLSGRVRARCASDLYLPAFAVHEIFDTAGIPHTYEDSPVAFLCGIHAASVPDSELEKLLGNGLIVDASAAEILVERGFSTDLGVDSMEPEPYHVFGSEECLSPEFREYAGAFLPTRSVPADAIVRFHPSSGAEILTRFVDHDLHPTAPAVFRFRNRRSGRIAVLPYRISDLWSSGALHTLKCAKRQRMWRFLLEWMAPGLFPLLPDEYSETACQWFEGSSRHVFVFTGFSFDVRDSFRVKTFLPLERAFYIDEKGAETPLPFDHSEIGIRLLPFRPLVVILPKSGRTV